MRQTRVYVPPAEKEAETEVVPPSPPDTRAWYLKFFGVFAEPRAWSSLLYVILALATGIIYFTWVVTGVSVSAGLLVLIIGIPLAVLFLLSVRGIALVEGASWRRCSACACRDGNFSPARTCVSGTS